MLFVVTAHHSADNCWARSENEEKGEGWVDGMDETAEEAGVELHGAYVTPNEHAFYFVLEADSFEAVTSFLGPPFLQDHEAHVAPVMPLGDAPQIVLEN
ncbi:DUF3303 domain-containing protein [Natrarchaeobius sp. A-rgal3]|uniref:DUF3303 domain-containing protein n=1 Tax=Natrarchaeobius versutus TaxID=1679078 RepID=UPI00350F22C3